MLFARSPAITCSAELPLVRRDRPSVAKVHRWSG